MNELKNCRLCPRGCGADRLSGEKGFCAEGAHMRVSRIAPHMWEEPCISGKNGSGAVFFTGCTMKCAFCQNYEISHEGRGYEITEEKLAEEMVKLQTLGAHNINLVTPSHFAPRIIRSLYKAKENGLKIPVIYNCGGYESVKTLKALDGLIDIYMPDMKYFSDSYAVRYSSAPDYFKICAAAIEEMFKQAGKNEFDENGMMTRGLLVRHMLLPGLLLDSKRIIDYLYSTYGDNIYISIMSQYTPAGEAEKYPEINKKIDKRAYNALVGYCEKIGIVNAFVQDIHSSDKGYIPDFYGDL